MVITTCCVIAFKVTVVYNLILALHSFGIICVSILQGLLCPATATPGIKEMWALRQRRAGGGTCVMERAGQGGWFSSWKCYHRRYDIWAVFGLFHTHLLSCSNSVVMIAFSKRYWHGEPFSTLLVFFLFSLRTERLLWNPFCFLVEQSQTYLWELRFHAQRLERHRTARS